MNVLYLCVLVVTVSPVVMGNFQLNVGEKASQISKIKTVSVVTATQWLKYTYWKDDACTIYEGEYGFGTNTCYPYQYAYGAPGVNYYAKFTYTMSGGNYVMQTNAYWDAECTQNQVLVEQVVYSQACAASYTNRGFYYTTEIITSIPYFSDFPTYGEQTV
jgi:hypothetical protein